MSAVLIAAVAAQLSACRTEVDCSLNGKCVDSACVCEAAWKGDKCDVMQLMPANLSAGYDSPHRGGNTSSWGGSVVFIDGVYHMYSAEMANSCGIEFWEPNSRVVHSTSPTPEGPYTFQDVVVDPFAHEPNAVLAPTGEIVIYMTMRHPNGYLLADCTEPQPTPEPTPPGPPPPPPPCGTPPPRHTYMTYAKNPSGPWSEPELVLKANYSKWGNCPVLIDTNLAVAINSDGSAVGVWRKCTNRETGKCSADCCTFPHLLRASDWKNASTYVPFSDTPLFPDLDPYGSEDPFVWLDESYPGGVHAILHDEQGATRSNAQGVHAFSADGGDNWVYGSTLAYNSTVMTTNGSSVEYARRERPHLILNENNVPTHLTNGVQEEDAPDDCYKYAQCDRSYTLVQPLGVESDK